MGTKVQALQQWCKKQAEGYRDVDIINMTSSWKNGLAFCAIIHRYRPDLIDYDALAKENILENNSLAFEVADRELGIPALLDAPDMVAIKVPDKLSVVTYVSQYYNYFHNKPQLGGPGVKKSVKRHQETDKSGPEAKRQTLSAVSDSTIKETQMSMGDKCGICKNKVYLLERHFENGKLYHRTCFRKSELSPTAKILKKGDTDKSQSSDSEKPNFWRRRADAKKSEQIKKEELKREQESQEKHDSKRSKAKSLNFSLQDNDEHKSSFSGARHRQEEKMDISDLNDDHKVKPKVDANSNRPVPKARNIVSSTETMDPCDKNQKEKEKRISVPKFEFRSKIVSAGPKACVVSKIDTDNSKPQPTIRHSAPSEPSSLSESPQISKSTLSNRHESGSPPPLPKNQPPHLPNTFKKESPVSEKRSMSPTSVKSPLSSAEISSKQDRLSELLAKDSRSSQGKWEGLSSKSKESESFSSSNTKQESQAVRKPKDINLSDIRTDNNREPAAVLISPVNPEPHDPQVLGGLLKNLANIRHRKDSSDDVNKNVTSPKTKSDKASKDTRKEVKSLATREVNGKTETRADKAKSVDILSEKKSFFRNKKESDKPEVTQSTKKDLTVSDEEPAWKRALEERKKKREGRSKSADLLSDKKEEKDSRCVVSMDVTKAKDERPAWQIEAEKRKAARQGGYVDPEKMKTKDSSTDDSIKTDVGEVTKRLITPGSLSKDDSTSTKVFEPEKKKISVGKKFDFKLHDSEKEKKVTDKPPRPPPMSPVSGHKSHLGLSPAVSSKIASTKKTPAPSPPRPAMPRTEIKTFGDMKRLSPQEIQHQLAEIDSRLTDLEIRGRKLEQSIRNDHSEEEDEGLMIEWFKIVNDKNELVRTEADLIYVSRAQELEDEQHRIDRELRELLSKQEDRKTEEDKEQEELLLQQLVDVVNQRSLIVDCQDEDRIRYEEEDRDIAEILSKKEFCKKTPPENSTEEVREKSAEEKKAEKKKKKKNKKEKKNKKDSE